MVSSTVFQAGGLIVVVVEVTRKAYLASLVPVIVDVVLNEHQVIADIVAFVSQGDFPRSRLGEKQRGKVLASWVTRKLRTIAQFSIRDTEGPENPLAEAPQHRASRSSKPPSTLGNLSLRRSTIVPENDILNSVPRSPAPVLEEYPQPLAVSREEPPQQQMEPHVEPYMGPHVETHMDPSADPDIPVVPEASPSVPQIAEPTPQMPAPDESNPGSARSPPAVDHPDFSFNFGDFSHTTGTTHQEPEATSPVTGTDIPFRNAQGRESLPSQRRFSSIPSGFGAVNERRVSQDVKSQPDTVEEDIEDWPQEALMYQSAMGNDEAALRSPSSEHSGLARTTRYDGSEYGF